MGVTVLPLLILTAFSVQGIWSQGVQIPERCLLDGDEGFGFKITSHFHFNRTRGVCAGLSYRGEGGNENRFETFEECENICIPLGPRVKQSHPENSCQLEIERGERGSRWISSFGFNQTLGRCQHFYYSGVGGNTNRFKSFKDCRQVCESEGASPPVVGTISLENLVLNLDKKDRESRECDNGRPSELNTIKNILNHVRDDIWKRFHNISENLLMKVALTVDDIVVETRSRGNSNNYIIAKRVRDAVEKVLLDDRKHGKRNSQIDQNNPEFFETLTSLLKAGTKKDETKEDVKGYITDMIFKPISVSNKTRTFILGRIDQIFGQHYSFEWKKTIFEIAHDVHYNVKQILTSYYNN